MSQRLISEVGRGGPPPSPKMPNFYLCYASQGTLQKLTIFGYSNSFVNIDDDFIVVFMPKSYREPLPRGTYTRHALIPLSYPVSKLKKRRQTLFEYDHPKAV